MATLVCTRCHREVEPMPRPPVPGRIGHELQRRVCADCWAEWQGTEVMVINELRLNFMDPSAQAVLDQHMRQFLAMEEEGGESAGETGSS
ncbi:MAG TPA: oxidative damage protection protein [Thermoanaerobaculia bacterium]|nr:oxidative damage protection protein [Thermoanaerobaculia bacterium]